jgi:hypothetical protein
MEHVLYPIIVEPLSPEGGGYLARVPDLPGCMSDGRRRRRRATCATPSPLG